MKSQKSKWLERFGIDSVNLKENAKKNAVNLMFFGNFNVNRLKYAHLTETSLTEPTRLELLRRDIRIWYHVKMIKTYEFINHPDTKEAV